MENKLKKAWKRVLKEHQNKPIPKELVDRFNNKQMPNI